MHPIYSALASALESRLEIISNHELRESDPASHLNQLKRAAELIEELQGQLPGDCDPHLRHYLKNSSFNKALALIKTLIRE